MLYHYLVGNIGGYRMRLAVLIPAYNEQVTIAKVIDDFRRELPGAQIYVYDNNSTDQTVAIAKSKGANIGRCRQQGKGWTVRKMFEEVDADIYIMTDADDTYPAKDVHKLISPVERGDADMVVGTRLDGYTKENKKLMHKVGNGLIMSSLKFCFPADITDMLSGYRVFSRDFVKSCNLVSRGFEVETELTVKAFENGFRIKEVPITYGKRPKGSVSKLASFSDGMYILTTIMSLFRDYRPMQFFILVSILPFAIAVGFGANSVVDYVSHAAITKVGTLILSTFFLLITLILLSMGFVASSVHQTRRELENILNQLKRRG